MKLLFGYRSGAQNIPTEGAVLGNNRSNKFTMAGVVKSYPLPNSGRRICKILLVGGAIQTYPRLHNFLQSRGVKNPLRAPHNERKSYCKKDNNDFHPFHSINLSFFNIPYFVPNCQEALSG